MKKWTFETLHQEALKYSKRKDFYKQAPGPYSVACNLGIIESICSHMEPKPGAKWANVEEIKKELTKYKSRSEVFKKDRRLYNSAIKTGLMDESLPSLLTTWNENNLKEEAKKYKTRSSFKKGNPSAYRNAYKLKILNEICSHMNTKKRFDWNYDLVAKEALKYQYLKNFRELSPSAYSYSCRMKILKKICSHMKPLPPPWTIQELKKEAKKYSTQNSFRKENGSAFKYAQRNGLLRTVGPHFPKKKTYTEEQLRQEALKYQNRDSFSRNSSGAYESARIKGILDKICSHMTTGHATDEIKKVHPSFDKFIRSYVDLIYPPTKKSTPKKGSIPDRIIEKNGLVFIVELKRDEYAHPKRDKSQIEKYNKLGVEKYQNRFAGVYLVSPHGDHSGAISFDDFKNILTSTVKPPKINMETQIMKKDWTEILPPYDVTKYKGRFAVTADIVLLSIIDNELGVLLIKRGEEPFKGSYALPGGFFDFDKDNNLLDTAKRELQEETGVEGIFLQELKSFSQKERDPREIVSTVPLKVMAVSHYALIDYKKRILTAGSDAEEVGWFKISNLPQLAFDHKEQIELAIKTIKKDIRYTDISFELVPKIFTIPELRRVIEAVLGRKLNPTNFRTKILKLNVLASVDKKRIEGKGQPAPLYKLDIKGLKKLMDLGEILFN